MFDLKDSLSKVYKEKVHNWLVPVTLFLKKFSVPADLADDNVCGGYDGQFRVSLSVTSTDLDNAGFVTHNENLIRAIRDRFAPVNGKLKASCEELAGGVINVTHDLMGGRLVAAKARVFNLTGHVDVTWAAGLPVPPFPRVMHPYASDGCGGSEEISKSRLLPPKQSDEKSRLMRRELITTPTRRPAFVPPRRPRMC